MYIYGASQIHAAQPLNAPHRLTPTQQPSGGYQAAGVDQLDISPEASARVKNGMPYHSTAAHMGVRKAM